MKTNMSSLQNLKEAGILEILWLRWENNPVDMSTQNLVVPGHNKCIKYFVSEDKYNKQDD